jgi:hypothetical protein
LVQHFRQRWIDLHEGIKLTRRLVVRPTLLGNAQDARVFRERVSRTSSAPTEPSAMQK